MQKAYLGPVSFPRMEAMILAAGLGTRLRPLTHTTPKALVEVGGVPLLERVARRLVEAGAHRLVVNVSPHADLIRAAIAERDGFGVDVRVSEEPDGPLDTGGGIKHARALFDADAPFLLHNVDILTDIDLGALYADHDDGRLATLAVRAADTDRYLLFDDRGLLGYAYGGEERTNRAPEGDVVRADFCGVQVISPGIFEALEAEADSKFSIITTYLRLADAGARIVPFDVGDALWIDVGTHERLAEAEKAVG